MIVWTCLDPAFPFFLCQSSCATLCAHIHHKKTCVSALKNITCPSQIPVVGDVTIHFGSRSWPHHHCCQKDPWQPGNLVDAKILFHSWKCKMAPVRICQSLIHQPFSCSPSYKLYTQSLPKSIYVRIKGLVTITSTGGAFAAAAAAGGASFALGSGGSGSAAWKTNGETGKTQENQNTGAELSTVNSHLTRSVQRQLSEPLRWCPLAWAISIIFFRN